MDNGLFDKEPEKITKSEPCENFVVDGRRITGSFEKVIVTCDSLSNNICFTMKDSLDGISLWDKEIRIVYKTPDGYTDFAQPHSLLRENGIMKFSWLLSENVARVAGIVTFAIRISDGDFVWNSLTGSFKVLQGISKREEVLPKYEAQWISLLDSTLVGVRQEIGDNTNKIFNLDERILEHEGNTLNPHGVTKSQLGLGNVDNTSDEEKPVSIKVKKALDEKENLSNKVSIIDDTADDITYPTSRGTKNYADKLISQIKTLLGGLKFGVNEDGILNISKEE